MWAVPIQNVHCVHESVRLYAESVCMRVYVWRSKQWLPVRTIRMTSLNFKPHACRTVHGVRCPPYGEWNHDDKHIHFSWYLFLYTFSHSPPTGFTVHDEWMSERTGEGKQVLQRIEGGNMHFPSRELNVVSTFAELTGKRSTLFRRRQTVDQHDMFKWEERDFGE